MKPAFLVAAALVGCGSNSTATTDAPGNSIDSPIASPDAPSSGIASMTITNVGVTGPIPVSIADASGTPTMVVMTDANGVASGTVVAGGSMTALVGTATNGTSITVLDVHPGDAIVVAPNGKPTTLGTAIVSYAIETADTNAQSISVSAGTMKCSGTGTKTSASTNVPLDSGCVTAGNSYDINAYVLDATNRPIKYQTAFGNVAPSQGNTGTVALGAWRTDFTAFSVAVSNAPSGTAHASAQVAPMHDGLMFQPDGLQKPLSSTMGTSFDLVAPNGGWSSFAYQVKVDESAQIYSVVFRNPATLGAVSVDLTTELLPFVHVTSIEVVSGQTMPTFHGTPDRSIADSSGALFAMQYNTPTGKLVGFVAMPASIGTSVQLPNLPDSLAAYRPAAPFVGNLSGVAVVKSAELFPDSKTFRETFFSILGRGQPNVPVGGSVALSESN